MSNLNPYSYNSVEYCKYELKVAKRNLELVTEAATARIKASPDETACMVTTEMSEAILCATDAVRNAEYNLKNSEEQASKE